MRSLRVLCFIIVGQACAFAQFTPAVSEWNQPVEPFKIIGNVYYIGANEITSYLITSPKGHIIIDSGFRETVPQIIANIRKLGFKIEDVKFILNSHAHYDHAGGLAELKRLTKAKLLISEGDAALMLNGGRKDPNFGDRFPFEPATPDETFKDGKVVKIGGAAVKALITAGHTPGCTTWTTKVKENGKAYNVAFVCSTSAPGYKLVGNADYPEIAGDYKQTFDRLSGIKVDVFLASHGSMFDLPGKSSTLRAGTKPNPFIDPEGYRAYLKMSQEQFEEKLRTQQTQDR
jgi:metallo-beta-lactamase class B